MSTTIRVSEQTRLLAAELAQRTGMQQQAVVAAALAAYEKALFWEAFEQGYTTLAADAPAWAELQAERANEAPALADES
ncbi:MAG: hypothetical protein ACT4PP_04125 [Sporichthyaceae bacterium]